ncbi:hypothetical protein ACFGXM_00850 [Pasteurella multocida]
MKNKIKWNKGERKMYKFIGVVAGLISIATLIMAMILVSVDEPATKEIVGCLISSVVCLAVMVKEDIR